MCNDLPVSLRCCVFSSHLTLASFSSDAHIPESVVLPLALLDGGYTRSSFGLLIRIHE
jgi:hypothetical protein